MIVRFGMLEFEILSENDVVLFGKLVRILREDDEEEPSVIVKPSDNDKNLEEVEEREEEVRRDEDTSEFINAGFFKYLVKDNVLKIRTANKTRQFDYEKVRKLYDSLPEESTYEDLLTAAAKVGLKIVRSEAYALMHFFSRYVDFDAELIPGGRGRGNRTRLVKLNSENSNEFRNVLEVERNVIGTPWENEEADV